MAPFLLFHHLHPLLERRHFLAFVAEVRSFQLAIDAPFGRKFLVLRIRRHHVCIVLIVAIVRKVRRCCRQGCSRAPRISLSSVRSRRISLIATLASGRPKLQMREILSSIQILSQLVHQIWCCPHQRRRSFQIF